MLQKIGITLIALLIALFAYNYLQEEHNTKVAIDPQVMDSNKLTATTETNAPESRPSLSEQIVNPNIDYTALEQLSSTAEKCKTEYWTLSEEVNEQYKNLINILENEEISSNDLISALMYLASNNIIGLQQIPDYYEKYLAKQWLKKQPKIQFNDPQDQQTVKVYTDLIKQFTELFLAENQSAVTDFLQQHPDFLAQGFVFSSHRIKIPFSANEVLGSHLVNVSEDFRLWWLKNYNVSALSIARVLEENVSDPVFQQLISNSTQLTRPIYLYTKNASKAEMTNVLAYALTTEKEASMRLLLEATKWSNSPFTKPIANQYLAHKLRDKNTAESATPLLQLLSQYKQHLVIVYNSKFKKWELLGYPNMFIEKETLNNLKNADVSIKTFKQPSIPPENKLSTLENTYQLVSQAEAFQLLLHQATELKAQCKTAENQRDELLPNFAALDDWQSLAQNANSPQEKLAILSAVSPVLVDMYTLDLLTTTRPADLIQANKLLLSWQQDEISLEQFVGAVNGLEIYEKDYLAAKLCEIENERGLSIAIENGWIYDQHNEKYHKCSELVANFYQHFIPLEQTDNLTPSKVYRTIKNNLSVGTLELIQYNSALNGFNNGRDSLALQLDHILFFKYQNNSIKKQVLEKLLSITVLKPMHYRRLHRLKLLLPNYFAELENKYPDIKNADNYPLSQYASFL